MQLDPQILRESPNLEEVQKNFADITSANTPFTAPKAPTEPIPPSEDPVEKFIQQANTKTRGSQTPYFSVQVSDLPNASRYPFVLPGTNYEELYAQGQGTLNKWTNALIKMGGITATTFLQGTLGTVNGVVRAGQDGKLSSFYDNEFSRSLDEFNREMEDRFPNYYTQAEQNASIGSNLLTANFWADKVVKNLGYAAGALASGAAWTKALQATRIFSTLASTNKMAEAAAATEAAMTTVPQAERLNAGISTLQNVAKSVIGSSATLDRTQRFITAGMGALSEAAMEALQSSTEFKNSRINEYVQQFGKQPEGEDLQSIQQEADNAGNATLALNTALLTASNYIQFPKILKSNFNVEKSIYNNGIKETENIIFDETKNQFVKEVPKTAVGKFLKGAKNVSSFFFAPSEAFEEGAQTAIGVGTEDYFNKKYRGEQVDFFSSLGVGVKEAFTTKEGLESVLIGGLSGAISQGRNTFLERREISANTRQAINAFNTASFTGYMKDKIDGFNRSLTLQEQRVEAIRRGDKLDANDLENDYLHNYLVPRVKYGRLDLIIDDINEYKKLASTQEGINQLEQDGLIPEGMTSGEFLQKLQQTETFARGMNELYKSLNIRYSGIKNEDKSRKYADEVIDRMVYASSKVSYYDQILPDLTNPLLLAGINVQPIIDSLETNNRPSTQAVEDAINQINNLNTLSDVKEDLKSDLRDSLEVVLRRKKFLKDYEDIKKAPQRYQDAKFGIDDLFDQGPLTVPQEEGELTVEQNVTYPLSNTVRREGNRLSVLPSIQVVGRTTTGQSQVRFFNEVPTNQDQTFLTDTDTLGQMGIDTATTQEQRDELARRYKEAVDNVLSDERYTEFAIPEGTLQQRIAAVNEINDPSLTDNIEAALLQVQETFQKEQEEIKELLANKEKLKEIDKQFEDEEKESSEAPTNDPTEDNKIIEKENKGLGTPKELRENNQRKPLDILFESTTSPNYDIETPNDNFHRRANKFLNNIEIFPDKNQIEVLLVTENNQDELGLSGLIPPTVPGEKNTPSTDVQNGIIQAVFVKGEDFVDVNGQPLGKIGEKIDLNQLVYQTLPNTSLQERAGNNRYIDSGSKASSQEQAEEAQEDWEEKRGEIFESTEPLRYLFTVSRGALNSPKDAVRSSPVGPIITQEMLDRKVLFIPMKGVKKTANVDVAEVPMNGVTYYFPVGRPLLKVGSVLQQLNNRKFTQEEKNNLKEAISNLPNEDGTVNEDILSFLKDVLYVRTPKGNPSKNQIWFENGYLFLGSSDVSVPFTRATLSSSEEVDTFLNGTHININANTYLRGNQFREIVGFVNGEPQYVRWKSYQHYLLSPTYDLAESDTSGRTGDRPNTPLYLNVPNPENTTDPYQAPFQRKYVTLNNFEIPEQVEEPAQVSTQIDERLSPVSSIDSIDIVQAIPYTQAALNDFRAENQLRFSQGSSYEPVHVVADSELLRYYGLAARSESQQKDNFKGRRLSEEETEELAQLKSKYGTGVVAKLKGLAKQSRSTESPQIIILGDQAIEDVTDDGTTPSIENEGDLFLQIEEDVPSSANSQTLAKLYTFLANVGISVTTVERITVNGENLQASGIADPINKLIQVVQGKENVALPEEAMHIAVDLIEQQNPTLFNQMLNKVGSYNLYNEVLTQYRNNPFYQKDGKPDIRKIKKEAIGKVLAETFIKQSEGTIENPQRLTQSLTWWQQILDFLRSIFNFPNPFEQSASLVLNNQILAGPIPTETSIYLQIDPSQGEAYNRISVEKVVPKDSNTVLDTVQDVVDKLYRSKKISKEQHDQLLEQEKRVKTDEGHIELSNIFKRLIDENGVVKEEESANNSDSLLSEQDYNSLFNNIKDRLQSFPRGTRFLPFHTIYNEKSNQQATPDLIAIRPNGTIDLYDFRFLQVSEGVETIPSEIRQLSQSVVDNYQSILVNGYNIPVNTFGQKRTIPILVTRENDEISSIQMGQVSEKETNNLLTPIISNTESTGNQKVDVIIERINGLIKKLQEQEAETGRENEKFKQIGALISSVRNIQLYNSGKKFINTAQQHVRQIEKHFKPYLRILKSGTQEQKDALKLEGLSGQILLAKDALDLYKSLTDLYIDDFSDTPALEGNKDKAEKVVGEASRVRNELFLLSGKLRTDVLARGVGIQDFLKPEKVIGWWNNYVRSLSQSPTKAGQILWRIVNKMTNSAAIEYDEETRRLQVIGDNLSKYATSKGTTVDAQFKKLLQIDKKGRWNGQLISKISDTFYTELSTALKEKNIQWIEDNIDTEAYNIWYESQLKEIEGNNEVSRYDEDDIKDQEIKEEKIQYHIDRYNIKTLTDFSSFNQKIKDFPIENKWESKEYEEIKGEKPLLDFYNYIQERNSTAHDIGMLKTWEFKNFVPNIRKNITDTAVFGDTPKGNKSRSINVLNSVRVDVNDDSFGNVDPLTGKNQDSLFAMYLYDLGENVKDTDGEIYRDYSAKSADLLKSFSLFNDQIIKYKYAKEVENSVNLLQWTEEERTAIQTSKTGGILFKSKSTVPVTVPNLENSKYFKSFKDYYFYGKKLQGGGDATFTINYNKIANAVNKVVDILPLSPEDNITISGKKALQVANRFFSLKVLGFNVASAGANLMGGSANAYISAGRFFTPDDIRNSQLRFASGKFYTEEGKKYAGLTDYFVTLVDNQVDNTSRELSVNKAVRWLSADNIMFLQRSSDKAVQHPVAMAFFDNTMVENGELVNIRDYVKKQNNYDNRYNLLSKEQTALLEKIEAEVQTLKDTRSLPKIVEIVNDQIKIPNGTGGYIERTATTVGTLRNNIQQYTKDIIGNMTGEDISRYKMNVLLQSFMMFKNWIPRMGDARFSEFRYNVGTDNFEWGRVRMLANAVKHNLRRGALDVISTLGNKNQGVIEIAKQMYQQKKLQIEEEQGIGSFTITEADFIDAYIRGIRSSLKELGLWLALAGIMIASQVALTDDDDKPINGAAKGWLRYLDRVSNELSFFYNPASYIELANGNIFPAIGIANDVLNLTGATGSELWYWFTGDEEAQKDNKVAKYVFKALPITKEITSYVALFNDDIAKELGIRINTEQRRRG